MTIYLKHTRTGKKFQIVSADKNAGTITLKGDYATFTEPYDKDKFKRLGYVMEKGAA